MRSCLALSSGLEVYSMNRDLALVLEDQLKAILNLSTIIRDHEPVESGVKDVQKMHV